MDKTIVILLLALAGCCVVSGQEEPLEVEILGDPQRTLEEGGSISFTCQLNRGLAVILTHEVQWLHVPLIPGASEVQLTEQQGLAEDLPDVLRDHLSVNVDHKGSTTHTKVTLTISNALASMDGKFICRAVPVSGSGDQPEHEVELVVPSNVQSIQLTFDGEEMSDVSDVTVQREEGQFGVSCMAQGFSPSATLQLFLGDQQLQTGAAPENEMDVDASKAVGARRYKSEVAITQLTLAAANSGETLKCVARADFPDATELVASTPLEIIALEPVIECDNNSTGGDPGDRYLEITCRVYHDRVQVDRYSFEIGSTGEIITVEDDSAYEDSVSVTKVVGMESTDDVTLHIYHAKTLHFETLYYLDVFLKNGQRFRETVRLVKHDLGGGSSKPAATFLCLFLAVLVWNL